VIFDFKGDRIGNFSYIYSPFAEEEVNFYQWEEGRSVCLYSPPRRDTGKKKLFVSFGEKYDVKNYRLDIDFDPAKCFFSGKASIEFEALTSSVDSLQFKLNPNLKVTRLSDSGTQELFFTRDFHRSMLYIHLTRRLEQGERSTIDVYYRGSMPSSSIASDVFQNTPFDETIVLVPPQYATYHYSRSSFWYPTPSLEDYFNAQLKLTVPNEYRAVATGKFIEQKNVLRDDSDSDPEKIEKTTFSFQTENPLKYLSFIVGKFSMEKERKASVAVQFYRGSEIRNRKVDWSEEAVEILRFYENQFGPFPYEELTLVERLWPAGGGHSPASFLVINQMRRMKGRSRVLRPGSPINLSKWKGYFLAHEIAHQWWGQAVAPETYHDQWISEGLAQFSAVLYLKHKHGEKEYAKILEKLCKTTQKKSDRGAITMGARLSYFDFEAYQSIVYNKCALVLNMLRDWIGEELFSTGIIQFLEKHKFGTSNSLEFFSCFNEISGRDLNPFFEGWFDSYLIPEIESSHSITRMDQGYRIKIDLTQNNKTFVFPLWIEWKEGGKKKRRMLICDEPVHEFLINTMEKPDNIKINPDRAVPGKFDRK
jgi:hypothetical protein